MNIDNYDLSTTFVFSSLYRFILLQISVSLF